MSSYSSANYWTHVNDGNTDKAAGGFLLDFDLTTDSSGFDSASLSILLPKKASPEIKIGGSLPAFPGNPKAYPAMYCTALSTKPAEGGSRIVTGSYRGFLDESQKRKNSFRSYVREESYPAGSNIAIDKFPGENNLAVRFNNIVYAQRSVWLAKENPGFPATAVALAPPSAAAAPGGEGGPWKGVMGADKVSRVYPFGWVLRSLNAEQVASETGLWMCEAEWFYEAKYQPGT